MTEYHKRHRDDDWIDEITLVTVPRFKVSGLSGDEWRTSVLVQMKRKGYVVKEASFTNMDCAVVNLPVLAFHAAPATHPWPDTAPGQPYGDGVFCDQPGCPNPGIEKRTLIHEYTRSGEGPLPGLLRKYRVFCSDHAMRGDGGREDSDLNYEETSSQ